MWGGSRHTSAPLDDALTSLHVGERSLPAGISPDAGIWGLRVPQLKRGGGQGNSLGRREKRFVWCLGVVSQQHYGLEPLDWSSEGLQWLGVFMSWDLSIASRCWVQSRQVSTAKHLLIWAMFTTVEYAKVWVWCQWAFELTAYCKGNPLGVNTQTLSLSIYLTIW